MIRAALRREVLAESSSALERLGASMLITFFNCNHFWKGFAGKSGGGRQPRVEREAESRRNLFCAAAAAACKACHPLNFGAQPSNVGKKRGGKEIKSETQSSALGSAPNQSRQQRLPPGCCRRKAASGEEDEGLRKLLRLQQVSRTVIAEYSLATNRVCRDQKSPHSYIYMEL